MNRLQIVVRINKKDYSAVSSAPALKDAVVECLAELQQLIFNTIGEMPDTATLYKHMRRFEKL
jgi:hypothetical protein